MEEEEDKIQKEKKNSNLEDKNEIKDENKVNESSEKSNQEKKPFEITKEQMERMVKK